MAKATVNEVITFFIKELKDKVRIADVALFGSTMNGERRPDSDIDIILISDDFKGKNLFERGEMTIDAEVKTIHHFEIPIDVLKKTPSEFLEAIRNKRYDARLLKLA